MRIPVFWGVTLGEVVPEDEGDKVLLKRRAADLAQGATYKNLRNLHQHRSEIF